MQAYCDCYTGNPNDFWDLGRHIAISGWVRWTLMTPYYRALTWVTNASNRTFLSEAVSEKRAFYTTTWQHLHHLHRKVNKTTERRNVAIMASASVIAVHRLWTVYRFINRCQWAQHQCGGGRAIGCHTSDNSVISWAPWFTSVAVAVDVDSCLHRWHWD